MKASGKTDKFTNTGEALNQFSRSETTKRSNKLKEEKSKKVSKVETMISGIKLFQVGFIKIKIGL